MSEVRVDGENQPRLLKPSPTLTLYKEMAANSAKNSAEWTQDTLHKFITIIGVTIGGVISLRDALPNNTCRGAVLLPLTLALFAAICGVLPRKRYFDIEDAIQCVTFESEAIERKHWYAVVSAIFYGVSLAVVILALFFVDQPAAGK